MSESPVLEGSTKQQRYESLVAALYQDVYRYAFWICKNQPLAEDFHIARTIAQSPFLVCRNNRPATVGGGR